MLRATASLTRRADRGGGPAEFALALDGEILAPPHDHEAVLERISELFDLVGEALDREVEEFCAAPPAGRPAAETPPGTEDHATPKPGSDQHTAAGRGGTTPGGRPAAATPPPRRIP